MGLAKFEMGDLTPSSILVVEADLGRIYGGGTEGAVTQLLDERTWLGIGVGVWGEDPGARLVCRST